jgi:tRNA pseudouridine38-40 synthase
MTRYRIDLAYHGGEFAGWARQPGMRTVQEELGKAAEQVFGEPIALTVAGRTDTGVHALGQVASFEAGELREGTDLQRALHGLTPSDVSVIAAGPADAGFDARHGAVSRTYLYRLNAVRVPSPFERGLSLWWPHIVDRGALAACAEAALGHHDFTAFTRTQSHHTVFERTILRAEWVFPVEEEGMCEFWIEAPAFMRGMVRAIVGTMLEVSSRRRTLESFVALLDGASRPEAGDSAQAHGLYLAEVKYAADGPT